MPKTNTSKQSQLSLARNVGATMPTCMRFPPAAIKKLKTAAAKDSRTLSNFFLVAALDYADRLNSKART